MHYTIIGSGPSGVHAALTLLQRGKTVVLYDVGRIEPEPPHRSWSFAELKEHLPASLEYFLGEHFEALIPPQAGTLLVYPPSRNFHIARDEPLMPVERAQFDPLISYSQGGLGIAWGANSLQFDDDDLRDFPIDAADLASAYRIAGERVTICGSADDALSGFLPTDHPLAPPLPFNAHESHLWQRAQRHAWALEHDDQLTVGHARMAVNTLPNAERACRLLNRCLWGCGVGAIYDPRQTLAQCQTYAQFSYRPQHWVSHLVVADGRVRALRIYHAEQRQWLEMPAETVVLAAGAIASGVIFVRTLRQDPRMQAQLGPLASQTKSLMDTQVMKLPYVLPALLGTEPPANDFQFNKLILRYCNREFPEYPRYIHGELLALGSLLYHPLIEQLPFGSRINSRLFFAMRAALGAASFFLPDLPDPACHLALEPDAGTLTGDRIRLRYRNSGTKADLAAEIQRMVRRALRRLGGYAPRSQVFFLPNGGGTHFAGTIPMHAQPDLRSVDAAGRSYAYENLYVADGASFPVLPSRSITLNLIAHAIRVAQGCA